MTKIKIRTRIKKFLKKFKQIITMPEMVILPGQLAYFFVLAIVPTITLVTMLAASLNLSTDIIHNFLSSAFSNDIASLLLSSSGEGLNGVPVLIVVIIAYFIASNGTSSIIVTSNTIYGIENKGYFKTKLKSFVMILILLFLFIILLVIPMFGDSIIDLVRYVNLNDNVTHQIIAIIRLLQGPILWCILFLFIKLLYTMAPDKKIDSSYVNFGAIFTTTCWIIVTSVYSVYLNNFADYSVLYGNLANLVILMLWFYFLAYIFTVGMALNYHKEEEEMTRKLELNIENN